MRIRRAKETDLTGINRLLRQVLMVHHYGRPDLFKSDTKKYTDSELLEIIRDDHRPVVVCVDDMEQILGYAFCILQIHSGNHILTDITTLYIDDLCVDEDKRSQHIGKKIYEYVVEYARQIGCYNLTLNVWTCNPGAQRFYEKCGLLPQKIGMEAIL